MALLEIDLTTSRPNREFSHKTSWLPTPANHLVALTAGRRDGTNNLCTVAHRRPSVSSAEESYSSGNSLLSLFSYIFCAKNCAICQNNLLRFGIKKSKFQITIRRKALVKSDKSKLDLELLTASKKLSRKLFQIHPQSSAQDEKIVQRELSKLVLSNTDSQKC